MATLLFSSEHEALKCFEQGIINWPQDKLLESDDGCFIVDKVTVVDEPYYHLESPDHNLRIYLHGTTLTLDDEKPKETQLMLTVIHPVERVYARNLTMNELEEFVRDVIVAKFQEALAVYNP